MPMTAQQLIATFPTFDDLPLNLSKKRTSRILRSVAAGHPQNLLLFGKLGTGKTTLAHLLPRWSYRSQGSNAEPIFMDCSAGLDLARLQQPQTSWASMFGVAEEWFILDEIDKVTSKKQLNSLHGILRGYAEPRHFILTANDLNRVPPGVRNRCEVLEIIAPAPAAYLPYAQAKIRAAKIQRTDEAVLKFLEDVMQCDGIRHVERELNYFIYEATTANSIAAP